MHNSLYCSKGPYHHQYWSNSQDKRPIKIDFSFEESKPVSPLIKKIEPQVRWPSAHQPRIKLNNFNARGKQLYLETPKLDLSRQIQSAGGSRLNTNEFRATYSRWICSPLQQTSVTEETAKGFYTLKYIGEHNSQIGVLTKKLSLMNNVSKQSKRMRSYTPSVVLENQYIVNKYLIPRKLGSRANITKVARSKLQLIKSKSKEPTRNQLKTLKRLEDLIEEPILHQRALTTQKKLAPIDEPQQPKNDDQNALRYNLMQLLVLMGKKDYYFDKVMKDECKLIRIQCISKENIEEIIQKIKKFLSNKVRYKYRSAFKMQFQIQLDLLKYIPRKKTIAIKNSQRDYDEEDEDTSKKKKISARGYQDFNQWKKKNNVSQNQKVFILTGGYHSLRDALIDRNWAENEDAYSPFFDLKWTCGLRSDDFNNLFDFQYINHFDCNQCLCSKYGLARNIRCINNWESFSPRCYDLGDVVDFSDFVEDFKISKVHSILLEFEQSLQHHRIQTESEDQNTLQQNIHHLNSKLRFRLRLCLMVMNRVNKSLQSMIKSILKDEFPFINPGEWLVLIKDPEKNKEQLIYEQVEQLLINNGFEDLEDDQFLIKYFPMIQDVLKQLQKNPQSSLQGIRNIWIIKPEYSSRGRGIRCHDDLHQIFDQVNKESMNYVAMKYIENPLIIKNRKFDIRQWVIVTELVPLKIYFYQECYIRFSAEEFDIDQFHNKYAHLTNNAIAKYSSKFNQSDIKGNMWTQEEFQSYLNEEFGFDVFQDKIQPKFKEIVINSLKCCCDQMKNRKKSFEVYGYDFMIDDQFNVWLIEVNMSPSSDTTTPVTAQIIPKMLEDIVKIIVDNQNKTKKKIGGFQLIYNSDTKLLL